MQDSKIPNRVEHVGVEPTTSEMQIFYPYEDSHPPLRILSAKEEIL